ncbi:MAG: kelch repeat-containing protein [Byssovorax sp.]
MLLLLLTTLAGWSSGCLGCSASGSAPETETLRAQFAEQSARVLDGERAFAPSEQGFTLAPPGAGEVVPPGGLRLTLPAMGEEAVVFEVGEVKVSVHEAGAVGAGALAGSAVSYPRAGGTSYWTATEQGYEEWLHLGPGLANGRTAVASWDVEGATLTEERDAVVLADEAGVARIRVTAPAAFAASGRAVEPRLHVKGSTIELWVDAGGEAVLVDPAWTATGSLTNLRAFHTQTLLANGKVLVAGGVNAANTPLSSAEIYDPTTGLWASAGTMASARSAHTATLLANGKVLVTGGENAAATVLATTELYDPATNTWSAGGSMIAARELHTATLLANGKVLAACGYNGSVELSSAEIYDPATNTWSAAASAASVRYGHTANLLQSGKVLIIAGGDLNVYFASAELYDPATNLWSSASNITGGARDSHTSTLLSNGKVVVAGGSNGSALGTVSIYDPATNTWSAGAAMATTRQLHGATTLTDGRLFVVGGFNAATIATTEIYTPATNTWAAGPAMITPRYAEGVTLLQTGKVLAAAGANGAVVLTSAEIMSLNNANGTACTLAGECQSGFCVDGFCCSAICNAGACDSCALSGGASANGTCTLLTGTACDDSNACTQTDTCQAGLCVGGNPKVCAASDACHDVGVCAPATGICSNPNKVNGSACNDGNPCTQNDTCQNGACVAGAPIVCAASDACHDVGVCNPATGICSNPAKANGAACNDGNACTQNDTCQNGACVAGAPVVCAASDACHDVGVCNQATGVCSNPNKANGSACNDGNPCTQNDTCQNGVCTAGAPVVCVASDACHDAGVCNPATGVCSNPNKANGSPCNDGNACTQNDTCQAGVCTGGPAVVCSASDQCHDVGVCNQATGVCSNPPKADGAACNDGNACTLTDTCVAGACTGGNAVVCAALDSCHDAGVCNQATGMCSNPAKADGVACDDGNACTQTDTCMAGTCMGNNPVTCVALDQCHDAGACDMVTGKCSDPAKVDGAMCDDGDACTELDSCTAGACTGGMPVTCVPMDECHDAGKCDAATGMCDNPAKADGSQCDDKNACTSTDVCTAGVCGGAAKECMAMDECHDVGTCDAASGDCSNPAKADGTPCSTGTCQKGVCESSGTGGAGGGTGTGGSTGSTGGSGGSIVGSGGSGGTGTTTTTTTSSGGEGGSSSSSSGGGTSGGCNCSTAGSSDEPSTLWLGLGLIVFARRPGRRRRSI